MKEWKGSLLLLLAAMIWGAAFVAQSESASVIGAFTFQASRSVLGALALLPLIWFRHRKNPEKKPASSTDRHLLWKSGILCGLCLFVACNLQQFGLADPNTSPGKGGFITATYIIMVPIAGIFLKKKPPFKVWIGVALAISGLFCLCVNEAFRISYGDFLLFLCAIAYTFHILIIDHYSPLVDNVKLSCIQFLTVSVLSAVCMLLFEEPTVAQFKGCLWSILYTGIVSGGIGYTLQIIGQRQTRPAVASLIMSMESVFSVLFAWILVGDLLSLKEIIGCILMFSAILLA